MFEFTRNFYTTVESGGGSDSSFTPGQVIIPEQEAYMLPSNNFVMFRVIWPDPIPGKLAITFDGTEYILTVVEDEPDLTYYYGEKELSEEFTPSYSTYPFALLVKRERDHDGPYWRCTLWVQNEGTHTISAKIPEEKSPKVLSFPKGRTIVSELSRLNKAFGTISKKKTIIGQLSDIADAAEAGKIGGGSGKQYHLEAFVFSNPSQVEINPGETVTLELVCNSEEFLNYYGDVIISNVKNTLPNYIITGLPYYDNSTRHLFVNVYDKSSETGYAPGPRTFSICAFGLIEFEEE